MADIKLAVFDVAGTTAVDDGLVVKAFIRATQSLGIQENSSELATMVAYVEKTMGQRKIDVFAEIFKSHALSPDEVHEKFVDSYLDLIKEGEVKEFPGVSQLFLRLKELGVGVAITTGFPRNILNPVIDALGWREIIDISVAASEVEKGRPEPDMIFRSMKIFSESRQDLVLPRNLVVVGDTVSDMEAGVKSGAASIVGIDSGTHTPQELRQAGATHIFSSATQLLTLINP